MATDSLLTSLHNPRIQRARRLYHRRDRDQEGLFLVEGYRELLRASQHHIDILELFFCPERFLGSNEPSLIDAIRHKTTCIYRCPPHVFDKLSYRDRPDGLISVARQMQLSLSSLRLSENPLLVIAETMEKPGNLGTILRSADAAGADGVIVCDRCTDIYNPNVVRASTGTLFTLPVIEANTEDVFRFLRTHNISIVATTPSAHTLYTQANFQRGVAIAVGNEQLGLTATWLGAADRQVRIPMLGAADSLNVATATTILLYETLRQRGQSHDS